LRSTYYIILTVLILLGCSTSSNKGGQSVYESYGAEITSADVSNLSQLAGVEMSDTTRMKISAKVGEICQMKGCWMVLENESGDPIRVTFKDYGFFVPKDISGRNVIVEGVVTKSQLSPEAAAHYAEDAGQPYDSTRMYIEYAFIADGVLIAAQE
jgi:hypothetical protein